VAHSETISLLESFRKFIIFDTCELLSLSPIIRIHIFYPKDKLDMMIFILKVLKNSWQKKLKEITIVKAKKIAGIFTHPRPEAQFSVETNKERNAK
jgi:Ni,Fe-hydrogenase I cytochrome b subunit